MSLAISWLCWNSAQSILTTARAFPSKHSAVASTSRVLPDPVGPKNKRFAIGRPGGIMPGQVHLVDAYNGLNRFLLADNQAVEVAFQHRRF